MINKPNALVSADSISAAVQWAENPPNFRRIKGHTQLPVTVGIRNNRPLGPKCPLFNLETCV